MGTWQGNKLSSDVAADSISIDSLSFTDLVSIQDQQSKSPRNLAKCYQVTKQDPEFEFARTRPISNSEANSINATSADLQISNSQLQPQALAFQLNQSLITNPPSSLSSLLVAHSSSKRPSVPTCSTRKCDERVHKGSKQTNKESTGTKTHFGRKVFKSFVAPCRECQAIKPGAVKAQTVSVENARIH